MIAFQYLLIGICEFAKRFRRNIYLLLGIVQGMV